MAEPAQGSDNRDLVALATMVDAAVRFGDRNQAGALAERLLEALSRHYRAMRPLRLRCEPRTGAALADEAFDLIEDVEHLVFTSRKTDDPPATELAVRLRRLVEHEADVLAALGGQPRVR
jgi:hypothetical protein